MEYTKYNYSRLLLLVHRNPQKKWNIRQELKVFIYYLQSSKGISFGFVIGKSWNDCQCWSSICDRYDEFFTTLICQYDTKPSEWILFRDTHMEKFSYGYKLKELKQYIKLEKRIKKIVYGEIVKELKYFPFKYYR